MDAGRTKISVISRLLTFNVIAGRSIIRGWERKSQPACSFLAIANTVNVDVSM